MPSSRRHRTESFPVQVLDAATVRFCGDSGDGMQVIGAQFTHASAQLGNVVSSLPDFPAEIRAPAGTLAGVSGFQVHFSSHLPAVPGDKLHALVAMNPAALFANVKDLDRDGVLVVNGDAFTAEECAKAGYERNPLDDGSLAGFQVRSVPVDHLNREAVSKLNLTPREADRCRNFFVLGIVCWLYERALEPICKWLEAKFTANPAALRGNVRALKAGHSFAESGPLLPVRFRVPRAKLPAGTYRHVTGNEALILGLEAAARQGNRRLVFACTPMTPASDLLHALQSHSNPDIRTVQAEDDAAAAGIALGAAFGGAIGVTAASGSGLCQMAETIGLAVMTELPIVIVDVQRGGPSTGLPTKTEQADLLQVLYGRSGECPVPVLAPAAPSDCFTVAYESVRIACRYMTPVVMLTDVLLAANAEPWRIPVLTALMPIQTPTVHSSAPFMPYQRDDKLARPWVVPSTPNCEHRIGGLEKDSSGNVSYDPLNHQAMVHLRNAKITGAAVEVPDLTVDGPDYGELLVLGWGATLGPIAAAVQKCRQAGRSVSHAHLRWLNPLPRNTGDLLRRFKRVLVAELNSGHLRRLLRAAYLVDVIGLNKVQGRPFQVSEIVAAIESHCPTAS